MFRRRGVLASRLRRTLVVHRIGEPSIRGVLVEEAPDGIVLRRALLLPEPDRRGEQAPPPVALDGDVLIRAVSIDFIQDVSQASVMPEEWLWDRARTDDRADAWRH